MDYRRLHEGVMRETHPLPKVDDTLAKLTGATGFSKLDACSGFWQIPLEESFRELTNLYQPLWEAPIQPPTIWYLQRHRAFSVSNEDHPSQP